jgi:predicted HTH domain antitoxin
MTTQSDFTLPLTLPSEFQSLLGDSRQAAEAAKEFIILGLYQEGRISGGKAAELLGLTYHGFVSLLARKGLPYFRYDEQEWTREMEAVRQWQAERERP